MDLAPQENPVAFKAIALKAEGTHPPAEGVLRQFAQVRTISSLRDLERVKNEAPDIVLVHLDLPSVGGAEVLEVLRRSHPVPVVICVDAKIQPNVLLRQLASLGTIRAARHTRPHTLAKVVRILGVSQEALSRILHVSVRTVNRWLKGARPRRNPELSRLLELVAFLERTLPDPQAIRSYLYHPNPSFGGERPLDLLMRGEFQRVAGDLQAVQEGVYL